MYVYYIRKNEERTYSSIVRIDLATKKSTIIKSFNEHVSIEAINENEIYYNVYVKNRNRSDGSYIITELMVLNLSNLKSEFAVSNAFNVKLGKNKIFYMRPISSSLTPITLCSMSYSYKDNKVIDKYVNAYSVANGRVYYAAFDGINITKNIVYVCNEDGTGKKALTGVINNVFIEKVTPDEVTYSDDCKYYKMNLKTKKVIEIK
ncbi:MAG: hypothetical protein ACTTHM_09185 [Peptoanaerobacter stomatis]|uniref:hypothetical protein n=1 Tax=Peptoanaerobacter stomatis TaxID=796937 RepID=UPI003FA15832